MDILRTQSLMFKDLIKYPDMVVSAGETIFLRGESGCGKSTLLKLLNASYSPTEGRIFYEGSDISCINTIELRQKILLVSQGVFLFSGSISDNFDEFYSYREKTLLEDAKKKRFLSICCADFPLNTLCDTMSGGERQRIYTAICLSFMPKVIMLDEPTSALDEKTSAAFFSNIKAFCRDNEMTIVAICHDITLAERFADRIIDL